MLRIVIQATEPRRVKNHLEAIWDAVSNRLPAGHIEAYRLRDYAIQVRHRPDGSELLTIEVA